MSGKKSNGLSSDQLVKLLRARQFLFSGEHNKEKTAAISELSGRELRNPSSLLAYHDILCFMQAYPGNAALARLVDDELAGFARRIDLFRLINGPEDDRIDDTGMVGTIIGYPYSYLMARWLAGNYGSDVDIDWDDYRERDDDPVSSLLSLFALQMENDGVDDENLTGEEWVLNALACGQSSLAWLLEKIDSLEVPSTVKQYLYDNAELGLKWSLNRGASRTLAKKPAGTVYYQKTALIKPRIDLRKTAARSRPGLKLLGEKDGAKIIDILIGALLLRHRELYPATFANPGEVYESSPGRGLRIFILGMRPEDRMPLETNYSALLIKNGVPIGYGIAVLFFQRCEIAINVFDTFRSGEASIIFDHFFRVFYHSFGARAFIMRRWQIGHENEEGLQSGSFWFYYKLGFRPMDPAINEFASAEARRINSDKSHRSDLRTLKKLALCDMLLDLRANPGRPFKELPVADLGIAVTRSVAGDFAGNGHKAEKFMQKKVAGALGNPEIEKWNRLEKAQFRRFSPLIGIIPDLAKWTSTEKLALLNIIRAKAAPREIAYVMLLRKHKRLETALDKLAMLETY